MSAPPSEFGLRSALSTIPVLGMNSFLGTLDMRVIGLYKFLFTFIHKIPLYICAQFRNLRCCVFVQLLKVLRFCTVPLLSERPS